jgi:prolyl-tRNA synthetase
MVLAPWCETIVSEEWVKEQTKATGKAEKTPGAQPLGDAAAAAGAAPAPEEAGKGLTGAAKTLCVPMEQPPMPEGTMCFTGNDKPARVWALWGRSY